LTNRKVNVYFGLSAFLRRTAAMNAAPTQGGVSHWRAAMLESLLIGLLYILLYAVVASIIVYIIIYAASAFGFPLPHPIPKLLWAIVFIIVLIMLISLLMGWNPRFRVELPGPTIGTSVATATPA